MMTMNKNLLIFFIFVIPLINFIFATPVLLSDQGTDLKLVSTGELLSTGNITIYIYDSVTGGSLIYSNLFINNITNGSWNVVINPNLEYGKHYWKDYSVNGDNLNFSGNDRIEFQSPLGLINNASLFNFSLINSCAVGSSIRQVYENGSVLCETDDTGSGGNSSWNQSLANGLYILQSTEGNLDVNSSLYSNSSTWWSGLSSWLSGWFVNNAGVLEFNETKLNNTIDLRAGGDNSSWNESYANTQYADISVVDTQKNASGNYVYNDSTTIYFNETKLNNTIDLRAGGDNSSWNESYANTQYASISEPLWSANFTAYNSSWSSTFNSTYDGYNSTELIKDWNSTGYIKNWNNTGLIINWSTSLTNDNTSWNESYANTRYLLQSEEGNLDVNSSVYSNSSTWWSGLYSYLSGWFVNNAGVLEFNETKLNNTIDLRAGGDNSSWNESYANTKYLQNGTSVRFTDVNSTGNITTEEIHFENDIVNHRIYDNSTCVIINGDTSTMYIC